MTLAVILLIGVSWTGTAAQAGTDAANQSVSPAAPTSQSQGTPSQTPAPVNTQDNKQASTPSTPAKPPAGHSHSAAKKPVHRKKTVTSGCDATSTSTASGDPPGNSSAPKPGDSTPSKNPQSKVIVRQGGTSDQSIQLAGGPGGDQAAKERDAATQMIGITEANLNKLSAQQLSKDQQSSVTQIREFLQQSRDALKAEDIDRARTLAWKAELLSEDLLKPEK